MKHLLEGKLKKVFLAKNCKESVKTDVLRAQTISGLIVEELNVTNQEVGVVCKKPYAVAIIGVLK
jgi:ribosomal protein L30E